MALSSAIIACRLAPSSSAGQRLVKGAACETSRVCRALRLRRRPLSAPITSPGLFPF